ncbi:hypothetical protein ATN88_13635 [Enterovibrio coralii]|uniref:Uncharacterized protein n=1 Tax=Enterovibrio coralii TaxID=294935 RepID=A0A135I3P5_9GAMM|nr:hypothetical protein ATN88_13635 [Enterovibrio coralii]
MIRKTPLSDKIKLPFCNKCEVYTVFFNQKAKSHVFLQNDEIGTVCAYLQRDLKQKGSVNDRQ